MRQGQFFLPDLLKLLILLLTQGFLFWSKGNIVKISKFQNELMKSSFLPKYEQKIVRISALQYTGQKSWQFFVHILGEAMTSSTHSEIY